LRNGEKLPLCFALPKICFTFGVQKNKIMSLAGNIHSFESFGTVDGPGVRFIIFAQGCPLRCLYCHNPDTWKIGDAPIQITSEALLAEVLKYKSYIQKRGGVTFSGGEPLLQARFVGDFFRLCRKEDIHTALDTSGYLLNEDVKKMLDYTDLVLLDIKTINAALHQPLTGISHENPLRFLNYLQEINQPAWIRHVVVPTLTHNTADLTALAQFLKPYTIIERVELLPYHAIGSFKYEELGKKYPLANVESLDKSELEKAKEIFRNEGFEC
jgi:pyruvate formate lyase activating enzyme